MTRIVESSIDLRLPMLINQAAEALAGASSAAEVLDAKGKATFAFDAATSALRLRKARKAHAEILAATTRAQADALEIEAQAKRRLADEFDAAQQRGEVQTPGGNRRIIVPDGNNVPKVEDLGLSRKEIHDARHVRDAIVKDPKIVKAALDELVQAGDPVTRTALKRAIAPVSKAIKDEAQAQKKIRRGQREIELAVNQRALPEKKYGLIYDDPEWDFETRSKETGMDRAAANHYPTSSLVDIMQRDIGALAADDSVLFRWAIIPMLVEAICTLDAHGFAPIVRDPATGFLMPDKRHARYVSHFAWDKDKLITGYWTRGKHEILLIATRGNPVPPAMGDQLASCFTAKENRHSAKPELILEWIDRLWPNVPKIELNRRGPARPGWDAWGNEADG